jgi:V/A-type H+-transporting ATPase subunit E
LGLQEILEKIKEETELKKQEILDKSFAERDRIIDDAKKKADQILRKAEEEKAKRVHQKVNALVADYVIKSNLRITQVKREILDSVYQEVLKRIIKDSKLYEQVLRFLFESLELKGDEEIFVSENEEILNEKFVEMLNSAKGWNLRLSEKKVKISGGFLAKGKNLQIDASLEKLMEILKEETEVHVSKILFD